ncbi:N-acetyltransferase GCN5 [endosymbiont of Acanthamoeba sp. UWC8]|uniref:GNAT family N-acetyltransferase n=1 Tax=endosymbiont of Acanthamoeba sp. UWC8 TaxID=86106 RepID=UPI0004D116D2|nr:GNAT family N-acetyltransferase [endosymbiont of Acanthamoeba sp. UWC8]AIF81567.1 N-acetyltransferase GCN5 [endosymbiont of Acanthamoeba sp. UWC8]
MKIIETERLILRTWSDEDAKAYFDINQDPKVVEFLPHKLTMQQVKDFISAMNDQYKKNNYTLFAAELKETKELIGFIGLGYTDWQAAFTPCTEIAWRLSSLHWGKGYATEGAKAALNYGFYRCGLKEIVSFTVPMNKRSIRVMEKIGMQHDGAGDFAHPKLPPDHKLSKHVLYRIKSNLITEKPHNKS